MSSLPKLDPAYQELTYRAYELSSYDELCLMMMNSTGLGGFQRHAWELIIRKSE